MKMLTGLPQQSDKLVFVELFARSAMASPGGKLSSEARLMRIGDI